MKYKLSILLLLLYASLEASSQQTIEPNLKFGKPSNEELAMTKYEPDSTASAVVLYDIGHTKYKYRDNEFSLITQHRVKIKVLKPEGKEYANVNILYYSPESTRKDRDKIAQLEAYAYNLENGKRVKTTVKNEYIVHERLNDLYMLLKFSVPSVREGTIIEYRYTQTSDYYLQLEDWMMQREIPVVYSEYKIEIPKLFVYNIQLMGKNRMEIEEKEGIETVEYTSGSPLSQIKEKVSMVTRDLTFTAHNLPALPDDDKYSWCSKDYNVNISFELQGVMHGQEYKSYTKTWEDIDKTLLKEDSELFARHLSMANPYSEEIKQINQQTLPVKERIEAIFHLLKQKLTWNGEYHLYSKDLDKVKENGTGSNADLNFIFISMLRGAGIESWPAILRLRSTGKLPTSYPSIQKINTFVVAIRLNENQYAYLDTSMDYAFLNSLPKNLSVEKARIISKWDNLEKWVDLTKIANNTVTILTTAKVNDNKITGNRETMYTGQFAIGYLRQFKAAKDSVDFIAKQESANEFQMNSYKHQIISSTDAEVKENIGFIKTIENTDGQYMYINPMIFTHISKNPFTQSERMTPIDLDQNYTYNLICNLTLPEGYEVEELPLSQTYTTEKGGVQCIYQLQLQNSEVLLNYKFTVNRLHFDIDEYPDLQAIWTAVAEKNNAPIVLKKL